MGLLLIVLFLFAAAYLTQITPKEDACEPRRNYTDLFILLLHDTNFSKINCI